MRKKLFGLVLFGALTTLSSAATPYAIDPTQQEWPKYCVPGCDFDETTQRCYCDI